MKKSISMCLALILIFSLCLTVTPPASAVTGLTGTAYTNTNQVHVRSGAGISYGLVTTLTQGSAVRIITSTSSTGGWYYVQTIQSGHYGYIREDLLSANTSGGTGTKLTGTAYTNTTYVNVRTSYSSTASLVIQLSDKGTPVSISDWKENDVNNIWYKVTVKVNGINYSGWILETYLSTTNPSGGTTTYSITVSIAAGSANTNRAEFYTTGTATVQSTNLTSGSDPALYNSSGSRIADDEAGSSHWRYTTVSGTHYYAGTYSNVAASYTITSTAPITLVFNGSASGGAAKPVPQNFSATSVTSNSVTLSWSSVSGAYCYDVWKDGVYCHDAYTTSYTVTGLSANTTYTFTLRVYFGGDYTDYSDFTTTITIKTAATTSAKPAPQNFRSTSVTSNSATLAWDSVSGANCYDVWLNGNYLGYVSNIYTSCSITGLSANTTYTFKIRVYFGGDSSDYSDFTPTITIKTSA